MSQNFFSTHACPHNLKQISNIIMIAIKFSLSTCFIYTIQIINYKHNFEQHNISNCFVFIFQRCACDRVVKEVGGAHWKAGL
jgi:hypothetical protein